MTKKRNALSIDNSTQPLREIIKGYLVVKNNGPILLTTNPDKAIECFKKCKNKDDASFIIDFTTHVERLKELGKNLFTPIPVQYKNNIIAYRNSVIKEWQDTVDSIPKSNPAVVWTKIAKKYSISNFTSTEFNQWTMDHLKYHQRCI